MGLEIELSHFEAENATLKGDYLWQVVEILIGGVPTVLEVDFMWLFMSLGGILLQSSVSTNLFDRMRYQVDLLKVEVSYCIYRSQPETEMSCTAGGGDVLYSRRRRCFVWPQTEMSCMASDGYVLYGRRR